VSTRQCHDAKAALAAAEAQASRDTDELGALRRAAAVGGPLRRQLDEAVLENAAKDDQIEALRRYAFSAPSFPMRLTTTSTLTMLPSGLVTCA